MSNFNTTKFWSPNVHAKDWPPRTSMNHPPVVASASSGYRRLNHYPSDQPTSHFSMPYLDCYGYPVYPELPSVFQLPSGEFAHLRMVPNPLYKPNKHCCFINYDNILPAMPVHYNTSTPDLPRVAVRSKQPDKHLGYKRYKPTFTPAALSTAAPGAVTPLVQEKLASQSPTCVIETVDDQSMIIDAQATSDGCDKSINEACNEPTHQQELEALIATIELTSAASDLSEMLTAKEGCENVVPLKGNSTIVECQWERKDLRDSHEEHGTQQGVHEICTDAEHLCKANQETPSLSSENLRKHLDKLVDDTAETVAAARDKYKQLETEISELQHTLKDTSMQLDDRIQECARARRTIAKYEDRIVELEDQMTAAQKNNRAETAILRHEISTLKQTQRDMVSLLTQTSAAAVKLTANTVSVEEELDFADNGALSSFTATGKKAVYTSVFTIDDVKEEECVVLRKVILILNKLNAIGFDNLSDEFISSGALDTTELIAKAVGLIVQHTQMGECFCSLYADLCGKVVSHGTASMSEVGRTVSEIFRTKLAERCQVEFDFDSSALEAMRYSGELSDSEKESVDLLLTRLLGTVRFLGQLFVRDLIGADVMCACLDYLIRSEGEEELVCTAKLFSVIGRQLEETFFVDKTQTIRVVGGRVKYVAVMPQYLRAMKRLARDHKYSSRVRLTMREVIALQANKWLAPQREKEKIVVKDDCRVTVGDLVDLSSFHDPAASTTTISHSKPAVAEAVLMPALRAAEVVVKEKKVLIRQEQRLCIICEEREKTVVLMPCRHLCVCVACSEHEQLKKRPLCIASIQEKISVFL